MAIIIEDKTDEEITAEILSQIPDKYQKNAGYFIWDTVRGIAIVFKNLWSKLVYLTGFFDLSKLDYEDLVRFVLQRRGIVAKTATFASGTLTLTGNGTVNIGALFETTDGLQFESLETKTIAESGTILAQCKTSGSIGNVPENTITVMPVTIQGIISVTNEAAFTDGYDAETKEALLERYLDDLRKPITSGNVNHYRKWALEVAGVGKVDVKPLWDGDNTVKVIIVDSNLEEASDQLVENVQEYIDPDSLGLGLGQAPIGAYCTVVSADKLDIDVSVEIRLKTGAVLSEVQAAIEDSINKYLKSIIFSSTTSYVSYSRIGGCVIDADGVLDYENLLLNNSTDNVPIADTSASREIAILNDLTVTEIEE